MPGPDGIPASAYKRLGELAVDILYDAFCDLSSPRAVDLLAEAYKHMGPKEAHAFNQSILCCLPKEPSGTDPVEGDFTNQGPLALSM